MARVSMSAPTAPLLRGIYSRVASIALHLHKYFGSANAFVCNGGILRFSWSSHIETKKASPFPMSLSPLCIVIVSIAGDTFDSI